MTCSPVASAWSVVVPFCNLLPSLTHHRLVRAGEPSPLPLPLAPLLAAFHFTGGVSGGVGLTPDYAVDPYSSCVLPMFASMSIATDVLRANRLAAVAPPLAISHPNQFAEFT